MITKEDREFVDFLFDKLFKHVDADMIDLHDSDSCDDHIQLSLIEVWCLNWLLLLYLECYSTPALPLAT